MELHKSDNQSDDLEEGAANVSSESTFFAEVDEVTILIPNLSITILHNDNKKDTDNKATTDNTQNNTNNVKRGDEALARLRIIFDKYLECPSLLDPHLEFISTTLCQNAKSIIHSMYERRIHQQQEQEQEQEQEYETTTQGENQEKEENQEEEGQIQNLKRFLSAIYALSKVRGRKYIQKYLSHDAFDVEPVLYTLRHFTKEEQKQKMSTVLHLKREEAFTWESIYSLLLWLGMLSLVPFDLNTIDSSIITTSSSFTSLTSTTIIEKEKDNKGMTLISSMLQTAKEHLSDAGPTREASASSLASLLSRPDLEEDELQDFVVWSNDILQDYLHQQQSFGSNVGSSSRGGSCIFLVMGVVQTLATVFKTGSRSNFMEQHLRCIALLWERAILVAEQSSPNKNNGSSSGGGYSVNGGGGASLLRKLLVKLFARVGCAYLPPRVAPWRYQRGRRSLLENLSNTNHNNNNNNSKVEAKQERQQQSTTTDTTTQSENNDEKKTNDDDDDLLLFNVPDEVEDCMAQLIRCLDDPNTTVRWSCAKGIGRVTERLPSICADDVLDAILELCNNDEENDCAWHGSCLALAELARRGLLLPKRLDEVVPIVIRAIQYDLPRGQHSVGSHVRDAACYTCWAFARAYAPSVLRPYVDQLSKSIVIACLFDREINCRRAASAAFQECVGRQGGDNFKHGIPILTAADYFSLGKRGDAYTTVAYEIAQYEEYCQPIIDHLAEEKLFHWDIEIRILSSRALRGLTGRDPTYFVNNVLSDLIEYCTHEHISVRHGAILGVAEIILGLSEQEKENGKDKANGGNLPILEKDLSSIAELVSTIEKARLYRGRGGEIVRAAVSRLIECLSLSRIPLTIKQQVQHLDSLDANLKHPMEDIQRAAGAALGALMKSYFPVGTNGPSDRLQKRVVDKYIEAIQSEDNPAATRGFAIGMGVLPAKLLAPNHTVLDSVIKCLSDAAHYRSLVGGQGDAETRRNAIESLVSICETVGIGFTSKETEYPVVSLNEEQVKKIFNVLLEGLKDYNTDRRGDVGSWSRIAAMKGLETLTYLAVKASISIPQPIASNNLNNTKLTLKMIPSFQNRLLSFERDSTARLAESMSNGLPFRSNTTSDLPINESRFFDDRICVEVLGALLKQLSEKLDAVRMQAGSILERLLLSSTPVIPFVPCRSVLLESLALDQHSLESSSSYNNNSNWANPSVTFPLVMRAVNIEEFVEDIISGIVISVGGLTESVTKHSAKSFLDYLRGLNKVKATNRIIKLGCVVIKLFEKHTKDGRVILPLLTTMEKILSHGCFDVLLQETNCDFPSKLLLRLKTEATNCLDMKRLMAVIPVTLNLLHARDMDWVNSKVWPFLMRLLLHRYPRIRRWTAEQLYVKLLEDDSIVPNPHNVEAATNLLSEVRWDQDLGPPGNVLVSRNEVVDLLGIELTDKERSGPVLKKKSAVVRDEFESYASLVQTAGR